MAIISIPTSIAGVSIPSNVFNPNSPLALLYGGLGLETYKYPADLATDPSKSHYVQFSISEIIPAAYNNSGSGGSSIGNTPFAFGDDDGNALPGLDSDGGGLVAGETLGLSGFGGILDDFGLPGGSALSSGLQISPTRTKPKAVICLYMPDTINAQYNASYDELRLTDLGSGINTLRTIDSLAGRAGSSIKDAYGSGGISSALKQAGNIVGTDPAAISLITQAGSALGNKNGFGINGDALQSVLLKGQGYAINPQLQMIYRGIGLRQFALSFIFTPRSQDESNEVGYIINMFKYHFAPSLMAAKEVSSDSMYLIPPSIFSVDFKINGDENPFLPKYGNCVLKDIDVNYTPNGWAAYNDGAPVQTTLNLTFTETEILDKKKIQKGYYGQDGGLR